MPSGRLPFSTVLISPGLSCRIFASLANPADAGCCLGALLTDTPILGGWDTHPPHQGTPVMMRTVPSSGGQEKATLRPYIGHERRAASNTAGTYLPSAVAVRMAGQKALPNLPQTSLQKTAKARTAARASGPARARQTCPTRPQRCPPGLPGWQLPCARQLLQRRGRHGARLRQCSACCAAGGVLQACRNFEDMKAAEWHIMQFKLAAERMLSHATRNILHMKCQGFLFPCAR